MSEQTRSMLVTGAAGFIGSNFVHYWLAGHPKDRIVALDALTYAGNTANLDPARRHEGFSFVHGDILDRDLVDRLLAENAIDTVVHFAAESHVDRSILGPEAFVRTNIEGTVTLLQAARAWWDAPNAPEPGKRRFHHISTDEVYGSLGPEDPAFSETTPYAPNSPYASSKAASDLMVRAWRHTYDMPVVTTNCSNNYGPYQFPEKLIPLIILNCLHGRSLPIYGDGLNIRDWLFVDDHCLGIELALTRGRLGETYNIGGNTERTNIEIVNILCALVDEAFAANPALAARFPECPAAHGSRCAELISFVKDRPGHDRRYAIDASKIQSELGYAPRESFESGIRKTLSWYLDNEAWWRAVMDGSYRAWIERQYAGRS